MNRSQRLRRPHQFQRVRNQGRTVAHPLLRLNVAPHQGKQVRCGFVVGKRIGKAVVRNRAKRRVREAVRLVYPLITPGIDLVFVIRSSDVAEVDFGFLRGVVETLLQRAEVWVFPSQEQKDPPC